MFIIHCLQPCIDIIQFWSDLFSPEVNSIYAPNLKVTYDTVHCTQ